MQAPLRTSILTTALGLLCSATPLTHAAVFMKFDGIKGAPTASGGPEVWQWVVTPLDPAVNGGVHVAVGDINGDGLDSATVALLLPAVQKVREAAAQWPGQIPLDLTAPLTNIEIGLLLPAVQKVREAAASLPDTDTASMMDFTTDVDPFSLTLLLPAVQKVREAASRPQATDEDLFTLLLPAARNAADVAGPVLLANLSLPRLLGLVAPGDASVRYTTAWSLGNGQVTLRMDSTPFAAVPEPGVWALLLAGVAAAGFTRRQQRAAASHRPTA